MKTLNFLLIMLSILNVVCILCRLYYKNTSIVLEELMFISLKLQTLLELIFFLKIFTEYSVLINVSHFHLPQQMLDYSALICLDFIFYSYFNNIKNNEFELHNKFRAIFIFSIIKLPLVLILTNVWWSFM
jgi:hypothetical protein